MQPFTHLTAIAAILPIDNVDTDMIIPKQFLRTIRRAGLGAGLFYDLRTHADFVLNCPPFDTAQILIAGANFGCGSSREHAPWALLDFGIRAVIAPSFADIFRGNCLENGILPLVLPESAIKILLEGESHTLLTIDLKAQTVCRGNGPAMSFAFDAGEKERLLRGVDTIGQTLDAQDAIRNFETHIAKERPWLHAKADA